MKNLLASLACIACAAPTLAQPADTQEYDGKWTATIVGGPAGNRVGRVAIANFAGTWTEVGKKNSSNGGCIGKKPFQITVQESTTDEFEFTVWSAMVSSACPDLSITLKPVDAKTLVGTTGQGDAIKLVRR